LLYRIKNRKVGNRIFHFSLAERIPEKGAYLNKIYSKKGIFET